MEWHEGYEYKHIDVTKVGKDAKWFFAPVRYCPVCGYTDVGSIFKHLDYCCNCKSTIPFCESKYPHAFYVEMACELYGPIRTLEDTKRDDKILFETEIKVNPLYDPEVHEQVKRKNELYDAINEAEWLQKKAKEQNAPRCPACSSKNLKRISGIRRAIHAYAFGLFSNTARSQFECQDCGYKF